MKLLCLDTATKVGWAAGETADRPTFGCHELPKVGRGCGPLSQAYDEFLTTLIYGEKPDLVLFEKPIIGFAAKGNEMGRYKMTGLAFKTEDVCHREGVKRCEWVNIATLKNRS